MKIPEEEKRKLRRARKKKSEFGILCIRNRNWMVRKSERRGAAEIPAEQPAAAMVGA